MAILGEGELSKSPLPQSPREGHALVPKFSSCPQGTRGGGVTKQFQKKVLAQWGLVQAVLSGGGEGADR